MTNPLETSTATAHDASLEERYFTRMAAAMGDKARILPHLVPGRVADLGAGGGELSSAINRHPGVTETIALDDHVDAIAHLNENPNLTVLHGSAERLPELAPVQNIVLCSVMHEVFSYGGGWPAWDKVLDEAARALEPGGRLIIRDGVAPHTPQGPASLLVTDPHTEALVRRYNAMTPFHDLVLRSEPNPGSAKALFSGTRLAVAEAALTVNWGAESLPRKSQERYMLATSGEYAQRVMDGRPFNLLRSQSYIQPEYREHLNARLRFLNPGGAEWFPNTNMLLVFTRTTDPAPEALMR